MSIIKLKTKGQVTLPSQIREQVGLRTGDILEASVVAGKIALTPKSIVDKHLEEGLADIKAGRTVGPFASADEMIAFLDNRVEKPKKPKK
jgi:AbrB family looped-hinge helix DNA binding protein